MAPKISRTMDDPRLPSNYGTPPVPPLPTGAASGMPEGLLKNNGPLQPGGSTRTLEGDWSTIGKPSANKDGW